VFCYITWKSKVKWPGGLTPFILNLCIRCRGVASFMLWRFTLKYPPMSVVQRGGCSTQQFSVFSEERQLCFLMEIEPDSSVVQSVAWSLCTLSCPGCSLTYQTICDTGRV